MNYNGSQNSRVYRGAVSPSSTGSKINRVDPKAFLKTMFNTMHKLQLGLVNPNSDEIDLSEWGFGMVDKTSPAAMLAITHIVGEVQNSTDLVLSLVNQEFQFEKSLSNLFGG
ncbi:hypothetical protein AMJ44_04435 [candidate division WOR-1 bacterium DG_54_3]|uniref:Uncharacterized protein n=1 Tax=candidate division WOR-1 bacterium DG_54_3 TaxID=1703775 RepID=A0A0S7Y397_UNCSA|nr:MAG: hypothetical protein AMJ44_04435 [candidate division WOR-1 bacterium DG_54_3]